MGEESEQLKEHIDHTRDELGRNLTELQSKVHRTFDWRVQFERRPLTLLSVAFGVGILLGRR